MEISVTELNELLQKAFERGRASANGAEQTLEFYPDFVAHKVESYVPIACRSCSNHPSNGGSGIGVCSLPDEII